MTRSIVVATGAFKHSLSAQAAAQAVANGLARSRLDAVCTLLPIADGGNGTLEAFLAMGGTRYELTVQDPLGRPVRAAWGLLADGKTAVIEMAQASGLELLQAHELDALRASTYGTGQLMQAALEHGITRLIIGMGGSATVDGGAGCLQALGVRLLDGQGVPLAGGGGSLAALAHVDTSGLDPRWREVDIVIASDVENPALGENGAAAVFAPQKGASPAQVAQLEASLAHFFGRLHDTLGVDVRGVTGGGAAGALAASLLACFNARVESGIDLLLAHNGFEDKLKGAHLVITSEGRMDAQTIYGKGPLGVARRAKAHGVPTVAIVGGLGVDDAVLHEAGLHAVLPIVTHPMPLEAALADAATLVERAALRLGYLLQLGLA